MDAFSGNQYELRRKFFSIVHTDFYLHDSSGAIVLWGRKKGFKLKEDIRLYEDAEMTREVLSIGARAMMDISGTYDVTDSRGGRRVGVVQRKGLRSILRDEWHILDANEKPTAILMEDSQAMALLRRFLSNLIPQSFHITAGGSPIAEIKQNFNPFHLRLTIDFSLDTRELLDRRLGLAVLALLGTIEGRQN